MLSSLLAHLKTPLPSCFYNLHLLPVWGDTRNRTSVHGDGGNVGVSGELLPTPGAIDLVPGTSIGIAPLLPGTGSVRRRLPGRGLRALGPFHGGFEAPRPSAARSWIPKDPRASTSNARSVSSGYPSRSPSCRSRSGPSRGFEAIDPDRTQSRRGTPSLPRRCRSSRSRFAAIGLEGVRSTAAEAAP